MTYLMESAKEGARLAAKTDREAVLEELRLSGLGEGALALDAGCASGAVTRAMQECVGPQGRVIGLDQSLGRLREASVALERTPPPLAAGDLFRLPFRSGSFDYVLCRLVLEYLREPLPVVRELLRVTRSDGSLVLADVDGYGAFHHPLEGDRRAAVEAVQGLLIKTGFDPFVGRKLFSLLKQAGALSIEVHMRPYHLIAGAAPETVLSNWRYKLDTLAPLGRKMFGEVWNTHRRVLLELLEDPDALTYSALFVAVGRAP